MMDPKLAAILKKAKAIDNKAREYDTTQRVSEGTEGFTEIPTQQIDYSEKEIPNLMEQRINQMAPVAQQQTVNPQSVGYSQMVENSNLPPEVKMAMMENPIPQAPMESLTGGFQIDQDLINEVNGGSKQSLTNPPIYQPQSQQVINEEVMDKKSMRRIIAEEVAKALPKVIDQYFDKSVLKVSIQIKVGDTVFSGNLKPLPKKNNRR